MIALLWSTTVKNSSFIEDEPRLNTMGMDLTSQHAENLHRNLSGFNLELNKVIMHANSIFLKSVARQISKYLGVWKTQKSTTGTGTQKKYECFKYGSLININPPPPWSAFLACKMDMQSFFKKGYNYKECRRYHSFQLNWIWDDALIIQNIFAFVCRSQQPTGELVEMWICLKIWLCYALNLT